MNVQSLATRRRDELLKIAAAKKLDHQSLLKDAGNNDVLKIGLLATALKIDVRIALNLACAMEGVSPLDEGGLR